ncbi:transcription antitermination factor NusB [Aminipila butyrica]|uniref:Transcription antitermination protein NusB n=1 Tax=Aminipila butyrica TaxID=433296 RepID=A0A858BZA0_9FIRM|nr:transcription antitermination factor NusB [Aminipila butyrica]QIB69406.1 transcription antitermination factor NusB [Aminipila butyrica]
MNRSEAREVMMQLLFQVDVQQEYNVEIKEKFLKDIEGINSHRPYIDGLFKQLLEHREEIDQKIGEVSANWKMSRMNKVDLAILRLSIGELLYMDKIPTSVSINEAVLLAKKFGTADSAKFINGILGHIARDLSGAE